MAKGVGACGEAGTILALKWLDSERCLTPDSADADAEERPGARLP